MDGGMTVTVSSDLRIRQWASHILTHPSSAECYTILRDAMRHGDVRKWTSLEVRNAFWEIEGYKAWFYEEARKRGGDVITENFMIAVLANGRRLLEETATE